MSSPVLLPFFPDDQKNLSVYDLPVREEGQGEPFITKTPERRKAPIYLNYKDRTVVGQRGTGDISLSIYSSKRQADRIE